MRVKSPHVLISVAVSSLYYVAAYGYLNAVREPLLHIVHINFTNWPRGEKSTRVLLISDIHLGNPTMGTLRLERIVAKVNRLDPDLVVIAGDFLAGFGPSPGLARQLVEPLSNIHSSFGVVAVLGNHDRDVNSSVVSRAARDAGVTMLVNEAVRRGPIVVGGAANGYSRHALVVTAGKMRAIGGIPILLAHEPESAADRPLQTPLMLVGHTHCGQIVIPMIGPSGREVLKSPRYICGLVRDKAGLTVVSGGLGTSELPFRFGTRPDMWLLILGPKRTKKDAEGSRLQAQPHREMSVVTRAMPDYKLPES